MASKFLYALAALALGFCVGCATSAVDRPAYPNPSWTDKVGSSVKSGAAKVTGVFTSKKTEGETDEADQKPGPGVFVACALLEEAKGDTEKAEAQYQKALLIDPNYAPALLGYAKLEDARGNFDKAMKHYNRALKKHPKEAAVHNDLGMCYHRHGKLPEAAKELEVAIELRPERKLYRDNFAAILVEQGKNEEALKHLVYAHEVAVGNYNLGFLLAQQNRNQEALIFFRKALEKDPNLVEARQWVTKLAAPDANVQFARYPFQPHDTNAVYMASAAPNQRYAQTAGPGPGIQPPPQQSSSRFPPAFQGR